MKKRHIQLRQWQEDNSVNNFELADMLGCSQSYISHIYAGRRRPSPEIAKKIEIVTNGQVKVLEMLFPDE